MDIQKIRRDNLNRLLGREASQAALGRKLAMAPAYVHQLLKGHRGIGEDVARKIEQHAGLPNGWMDQPADAPPIHRTTYAVRDVDLLDRLGEHPDLLAYVQIRRYRVRTDHRGGGMPQWIEIDEETPLLFPARAFSAKGHQPSACKAIAMDGAAMAPTLQPDDVLLIDTERTDPEDERVYALVHAGELLVRRLFRRPGGGLELRPDNPRYPSHTLSAEEAAAVTVLGEQVWRGG
jgi:phage repressor protein C with HTH and peptisase S24 domain